MKSLNDIINEQVFDKDKYQGVWSGEKYVVLKYGSDKIELIGNKHKSPKQQIYVIKKNKEQIGTFDFDVKRESYFVTSDKTGGTKEFKTVDDIIEFVIKQADGLDIHDGSMK